MGEVDEVTQRIFDALDVIPERLSDDAVVAFRDRGDRDQDPRADRRHARAGLVVGETLELLRVAVRAGMTTGELDAIAEDNIRSLGRDPVVPGLRHPPFPATICASVNDEVVHGIPGDRVLADGDVDLDRLRRDRRRLARRRRDHRRGRRGARRGAPS